MMSEELNRVDRKASREEGQHMAAKDLNGQPRDEHNRSCQLCWEEETAQAWLCLAGAL